MGDARRLLSARGSVLWNGGVFWKRSCETHKGSSLCGVCSAPVCYENPKLKNTKLGPAHWNFGGCKHISSKGRTALGGLFRSVFNIDSSGICRVLLCGLVDDTFLKLFHMFRRISTFCIVFSCFCLAKHFSSLDTTYPDVYFLQISEVCTAKCVLWVSSKSFCLFSTRILLYDFLTSA